ncbi:hypothetical protein ACFZBU_45270 [Embleya sp. NPDC008237]|uniref:hypothetical protein n=1 Tax=Embleya sp. NPDC008237 TaxID=3363978 RepID=UPI0036EC469D
MERSPLDEWQAVRRVVDGVRRDGAFEARTSTKALAAIAGCAVPLLAAMAGSFASPNPDMPKVLVPVMAVLLVPVVVWIVRLVVPRVRLRVDADGIAVRGRHVVAWEDVAEFRTGIAAGRAPQSYVLVERVGAAGPLPPVKLPILLDVDTAILRAALNTLLVEQREGTQPGPGPVRPRPSRP